MAELNENAQKGMTLMQEALKNLVDGNIDGFQHNRKEANRYFDKFYESVTTEEGMLSEMYGTARNFGVIYNVFEQNIDKLYENKNKKHVIKDVYNLIKNNRLLSEQFKIYDMFEKAKDVDNPKEFVNEATSLIKRFNKRAIKENNEKLIRFIRKNKLDEFVEIPEETENLYEAIEYIILNKKNLQNVNKFIKAQNIIAEHIEKNNRLKLEENQEKPTFDTFKEEVNKKEEEINEQINDDEKKLLDLFSNPKTNKRTVFENYKSQTLKKIENVMNTSEDEDKSEWKNIYENVNSKTYSNKMSQNIINCAEMMEICSTIEE